MDRSRVSNIVTMRVDYGGDIFGETVVFDISPSDKLEAIYVECTNV